MINDHEVVTDMQFSVSLSNLPAHGPRLPKNTVVAIAVRSPIALISLSAPVDRRLSRLFHTFLPIGTGPDTSPSLNATTGHGSI